MIHIVTFDYRQPPILHTNAIILLASCYLQAIFTLILSVAVNIAYIYSYCMPDDMHKDQYDVKYIHNISNFDVEFIRSFY